MAFCHSSQPSFTFRHTSDVLAVGIDRLSRLDQEYPRLSLVICIFGRGCVCRSLA